MRAALGLGNLDLPEGLEVVDVDAGGIRWLKALLDDAVALDRRARSRPRPGSTAVLRPYQERGVGWMVFLGRLGLGACLADDMGLGKTAQVIATLLADPGEGPGAGRVPGVGARELGAGTGPLRPRPAGDGPSRAASVTIATRVSEKGSRSRRGPHHILASRTGPRAPGVGRMVKARPRRGTAGQEPGHRPDPRRRQSAGRLAAWP